MSIDQNLDAIEWWVCGAPFNSPNTMKIACLSAIDNKHERTLARWEHNMNLNNKSHHSHFGL